MLYHSDELTVIFMVYQKVYLNVIVGTFTSI